MTPKAEALARARAALTQAEQWHNKYEDRWTSGYLIATVRALEDALEAEDAQPEPASEWRRERNDVSYCLKDATGYPVGEIRKVESIVPHGWHARQWNSVIVRVFPTEAEALAWLGVPDDAAREMTRCWSH